MRPRSLAEVVGQTHLLKPGSLLPRLVAQNRFGSLLFYGPPGCGKTSIAEAIARETQSRFVRVNAVMSNVAELREILAAARRRPEAATILFIDELHRFNKSQQDLLLPDVEEGNVRLIGATTHNPGFYVNPPLLSRSHLFRLEPLATTEVAAVLKNALVDLDRGLGARRVTADDTLLASLAVLCDGDLRRALNALEVLVLGLAEGAPITPAELAVFARERRIRYDADEDEHHDTISAFIKSCRGSDPDAAMYWLARMLTSGEDPRFIARRLTIFASEDVGNADPRALQLAIATWDAVERVGMPEAQLNLGQCVAFLACCPKSNASAQAIWTAMDDAKEGRTIPVPMQFQDQTKRRLTTTGADGEPLAADRVQYEDPHAQVNGVGLQDYLGVTKRYYEPVERGLEIQIAERLRAIRAARETLK
jgi:putative ATPase